MSERLCALGERVGILPEYVNFDGTQRIVTSDETYAAILKALGFSVDEESLQQSLESFRPDNSTSQHSSDSVRCVTVEQRIGKRQARGVWLNLYSIRSATNWGVGDFGDLRRLVKWAGETGFDFVALNPLHALRNRGHDVSPYRPVSRLYRNDIYLEIDAIPEFAECAESKRLLASGGLQENLQQAVNAPSVDYHFVRDLKRTILKVLQKDFQRLHGSGNTQRGKDYAEYLQREGDTLRDFATFMTFDDQFLYGGDPRDGVCDHASPTVEQFRREYSADLDFHYWIQFELDRQLASIAEYAKECGLSFGLMGDLAIGTAPDGSDPWAYPELFLKGVSIGAPPDDLGPVGQNWGLPPVNPHKLKENDYEFFRRVLRNNLTHMGALRIDHVMGLLRQFWIPDGFDGSKGAYMWFPAEDLFRIVAEESQRARAVIVGEDLGTVPDGFRELMSRFGVLSTRVVHFERDWDGGYKPADHYPPEAYAVVGTHDMVPLAGFAVGRDLQLRKHVGLIPDEDSLQQALEQRRLDWERLNARLLQEGFAIEQGKDEIPSACRALIQFLYRSPCAMAGVALDDLAAEREPVNVPGVGQDRHQSWTRRMTISLEEIIASKAIRDLLS